MRANTSHGLQGTFLIRSEDQHSVLMLLRIFSERDQLSTLSLVSDLTSNMAIGLLSHVVGERDLIFVTTVAEKS